MGSIFLIPKAKGHDKIPTRSPRVGRQIHVKVNSTMPHEKCWLAAHHKPLKSVTHGECDARPTVTFPVAIHRCPETGIKLCCLVTEAHVCGQLAQGRYLTAKQPEVELATSRVAS